MVIKRKLSPGKITDIKQLVGLVSCKWYDYEYHYYYYFDVHSFD